MFKSVRGLGVPRQGSEEDQHLPGKKETHTEHTLPGQDRVLCAPPSSVPGETPGSEQTVIIADELTNNILGAYRHYKLE